MPKRDYYETLGLARGASEQDLKSALRVRQFLLAAGEPCQILVAGYDAPAAS